MKRMLAAAALLAFLPAAHAQDKGKSEFTHNGEFRTRDYYFDNMSGNKNSHADNNTTAAAQTPAQQNTVESRFKLGLGFKPSEKFSAQLTLLANYLWGHKTAETVANYNNTVGGTDENFMTVNEAYGAWMFSDSLNLKIGRMNYGFGDGTVMGVNDFQALPYSYDGVLANYELEFGRFQAFGFKYRDLNNLQNAAAGNVQSKSSDPEHNSYGLVFDLKAKPEFVKMVNVNLIQDISDLNEPSGETTVRGTQGQNVLRYGASTAFAFSMIDLKANYQATNGKFKTSRDYNTSEAGQQDSRNVETSMYQAEVGFNLPAFMNSRIYVGYHQDSGTKSGADDRTVKTYDSYMYERNANAGLMDLLEWGNLTYTHAGITAKPTDATEVGLAYYMFSKTEKEDSVNAGTNGTYLFPTSTGTGRTANNTQTDKAKIGDEIDLWAEHKYDGGLSILTRVGYFTPGDALKTGTSTLFDRKDAITQFWVQGRLTF